MARGQSETTDSFEESGGSIPGSSNPAYSLKRPINPPIPVLIAVPHAGRDYPDSVFENMREPRQNSMRLEDRHVDVLAAEVARLTGAALLTAHAPRAMLDLNRDREDVDWGMVQGKSGSIPRHSQTNRRARSGLGLVPRRLPGFGEIWRAPLTAEELRARIDGIHRPYHEAVGRTLDSIRDEWGAALLVDFHSMPPLKRRYGQDRAAQFVIGDRFGSACDQSLASRAFSFFDLYDLPASHNRPYSGGFVLDHHASPARGLHALQLEICRSVYLDSRLDKPSHQLGPLAETLANLVRELGAATARLAQSSQFAQAAE